MTQCNYACAAEVAEYIATVLRRRARRVSNGGGGGGSETMLELFERLLNDSTVDTGPGTGGSVGWYPTDDVSTLYTDVAKTTNVAVNGNRVRAIEDYFGVGVDGVWDSSFATDVTWDDTGYINNGGNQDEGIDFQPPNSDTSFFAFVVRNLGTGDSDFVLLNFDSSVNLAVRNSPFSFAGTGLGVAPEIYCDGVQMVTEQQLWTVLSDLQNHVITMRNIEVGGLFRAFWGNFQSSTTLNFGGLLADMLIATDVSAADARLVEQALAARHGITLP